MPIVITLPWPARALHPNARGHWSKKAKASAKAREAAGWEAVAQGITPIDAEAVSVTAIFFPPDRRARDLDGMLSSLKPSFDGIADVLGVDDSKWSFTLRKAEPRPPLGQVEIQIEVSA